MQPLVICAILVSTILTGLAVHATPSRCQSYLETTEILKKIDGTAAQLRGQAEFNSPKRWRTLSASYGLPGLDLPKNVGGSNLSASEMVQVFTHAGHLALDLRDVVGAGHARLLLQAAEPQTQAILSQVSSGRSYVAIAMTEENAGSDIHAMTSKAEKVEGGYILTGSKLYNARLRTASHVILFTQAPQNNGKLNAFILPIDFPGLQFSDLEAPGLRGNSFGGVSFDHLFVPEAYRIGKDAQGGALFRNHFLYWRLMMAAAAIGTGHGALDQVADRLRTRQAFGGPIGRFTHLQQPLAEHTAKLHMATLLIQEAAKKFDAADFDEAAPLIAMAKAEGVEIALAAAEFAMKTFGAEGYSNRVDLGQRVFDLMGLRIADGTTDVLRQEVVRKIYGNDLWDMAVGNNIDIGTSWIATETAISSLQQRQQSGQSTLATQAQFESSIKRSGGGSCATVTAFNLLQTLVAIASPQVVLDPSSVIPEAFTALPGLCDGRVTNAQLVQLLTHFKKYLPSNNYSVSLSSAPDAIPEAWAGETHLLVYKVFSGPDNVVGRHFVVLKNKADDLITVMDPLNPTRDFKYRLNHISDAESSSEIHLVRAEGWAADRKLVLDAIATVRLR